MTTEIHMRLDELHVNDLVCWRDGQLFEIARLSLEGDEITIHTKDGWRISSYSGNRIAVQIPAPTAPDTAFEWVEQPPQPRGKHGDWERIRCPKCRSTNHTDVITSHGISRSCNDCKYVWAVHK